MREGRDIQSLAKEILRVAESKRDFIAPCRKLSVAVVTQPEVGISGALRLQMQNGNGGFDFGMTSLFHDQLANKLGIPVRYYERMMAEAPGLLAENANYWLQNRDESQMVRTLDGQARAFLSDRYRPLDNEDLFEAVYPAMIKAGCRIESADLTPTRFYIKAVTERIQGAVRGQIVQAGLAISNSEVGLGAVRINPLLFELACLNGMVVNKMGQFKFHIGRSGEDIGLDGAAEFYRDETRELDDRAFWSKVVDTANGLLSVEGFDSVMEKYRATMGDTVEASPVKAVEEVARKFQFSDSEKDSVLKYLVKSGDLNRYGVINAVTRASQDIPDYDRASEFEVLGGRIMELPKRDWEAIAYAK